MRILPRYLLLLALPGMAAAASPDYDLLEGLGDQTTSGTGTALGLQLNASYQLGDGFFAESSAARLHNGDVPGGLDADRDFAGLGLRAHFELTDVFLSVDWLHLHQDAGGVSTSADGYHWVWGLRSGVSDKLELNFGIEKSNVGENHVGLRLGESWAFTDVLSLRAQYVHFPDAHSWVLGLRYYY
jgi:opacity protein-like surface antigen